ncbi:MULTISPECIES: antibiotic biosynthesis monooxygenase family protein [unclassified Nocardia]|uniref:antibiotic biosynthesis monooxygenase family protein n=1 Tax=unclassified Nocardia TaxID=2637762 RepID=UPI0033BE1C30
MIEISIVETSAARADALRPAWRPDLVPGVATAVLLRAIAKGTAYQLVSVGVVGVDNTTPLFTAPVTAATGSYGVAAQYTAETRATDPGIVFVNAFDLPVARIDEFIGHWHTRAGLMSRAPGFRDNRLHRAIDPDVRFPLINIAHWDGEQAWHAAGANPEFQQRLSTAPGYAVAHPALYTVVAEFPAGR